MLKELHGLLQLLKNSCCFLTIFRENDEENLAHTVFTQYINEQENQMEAELAFDASFFKANRKVKRAVFDLSFIPHCYFTSHPRVGPSRISRGACAVRTSKIKPFLLPASKQAILPVLEVAGGVSFIFS